VAAASSNTITAGDADDEADLGEHERAHAHSRPIWVTLAIDAPAPAR